MTQLLQYSQLISITIFSHDFLALSDSARDLWLGLILKETVMCRLLTLAMVVVVATYLHSAQLFPAHLCHQLQSMFLVSLCPMFLAFITNSAEVSQLCHQLHRSFLDWGWFQKSQQCYHAAHCKGSTGSDLSLSISCAFQNHLCHQLQPAISEMVLVLKIHKYFRVLFLIMQCMQHLFLGHS